MPRISRASWLDAVCTLAVLRSPEPWLSVQHRIAQFIDTVLEPPLRAKALFAEPRIDEPPPLPIDRPPALQSETDLRRLDVILPTLPPSAEVRTTLDALRDLERTESSDAGPEGAASPAPTGPPAGAAPEAAVEPDTATDTDTDTDPPWGSDRGLSRGRGAEAAPKHLPQSQSRRTRQRPKRLHMPQ